MIHIRCNHLLGLNNSLACHHRRRRDASVHAFNAGVVGLFFAFCFLQQPGEAQAPSSDYQQALAWIASGRQLLAQHRYSEAQAQFSRYANCYPADPRGFFWLGIAQDEGGDPAGALKMYSRSLDDAKDIGMDSAELRTNLGNTLLKLQYTKEAAYDFKRALEIDPTEIRAHLGLAQTDLLAGDWQDALNQLQTCSSQGFNDPSMPYLKARALLALGRPAEAREQLQLYERGVPGAGIQLIDNARAMLQQLPR